MKSKEEIEKEIKEEMDRHMDKIVELRGMLENPTDYKLHEIFQNNKEVEQVKEKLKEMEYAPAIKDEVWEVWAFKGEIVNGKPKVFINWKAKESYIVRMFSATFIWGQGGD